MKHKYTSISQKNTEKIATEFAQKLKAGDVVFLIGDLGAGKSTFVRGVAKALGVTTRVLSPTFSIIRTHSVSHPKIHKLHHVDLYRAEGKDESIEQILNEFQDEKDAVILIEWPKDHPSLKANHIVKFAGQQAKRTITFEE